MHETEMGPSFGSPSGEQRSGRWSGRRRFSPSGYLAVFDDSNFEDHVLASPLPVVIDFWAETCVPCRLQEPIIDALACELQGRARVGRLNVFDNPVVPQAYQIKGVPHLMVVRDGEVVLELVGDHSLPQLRERLGALGI